MIGRQIVSIFLIVAHPVLNPSPAKAQCGEVSLNEIDYDQEGTDTLEFVALKGNPGVILSGYELHFINGSNGGIYLQQPLTGTLSADGYHVVGAQVYLLWTRSWVLAAQT